MRSTNLRFESRERPSRRFQAAVSLHSHTLHSHERLDFVYRIARHFPPLRFALEQGETRYRSIHGCALDLTRAWWTPPLAPHHAWLLEARRIQNHFGLNAFVSLTDHDDIQAPLALRVLEECRNSPISVEWTVPYEHTFFHLGVHNLDAERAWGVLRDLSIFTADPRPGLLLDLLGYLNARPETLLILNHPHWDEKGIGEAEHRASARRFMTAHSGFIHALELNGLRPWKENRGIFQLAAMFGKPLISGGDRHALEPNATLNLTNASTFAEFVEEIREGSSDVLVTNQYLEPFPTRILQSLQDVLGHHENHALGWRRWSDRVFYACDDGAARSLAQLWKQGEPLAVRVFLQALRLLRHPHMKHAFRLAFTRGEEVIS
jgi:hypothetical protein